MKIYIYDLWTEKIRVQVIILFRSELLCYAFKIDIKGSTNHRNYITSIIYIRFIS